MDNRLRVDHNIDIIIVGAEQVVSLDDLKTLLRIEQMVRVAVSKVGTHTCNISKVFRIKRYIDNAGSVSICCDGDVNQH